MWQIVVWIALQVASFLLRPKQKSQKITPEELEGTTIDAYSPVPILFGTRRIKTPNLVWYGNVRTTAVKSCAGKK